MLPFRLPDPEDPTIDAQNKVESSFDVDYLQKRESALADFSTG